MSGAGGLTLVIMLYFTAQANSFLRYGFSAWIVLHPPQLRTIHSWEGGYLKTFSCGASQHLYFDPLPASTTKNKGWHNNHRLAAQFKLYRYRFKIQETKQLGQSNYSGYVMFNTYSIQKPVNEQWIRTLWFLLSWKKRHCWYEVISTINHNILKCLWKKWQMTGYATATLSEKYNWRLLIVLKCWFSDSPERLNSLFFE